MEEYHTVVAVFGDHDQVEAAVKKLAATGFDNLHISVVGEQTTTTQSSAVFTAPAIESSFGASWAPFGAASGGGLAGWSSACPSSVTSSRLAPSPNY